MRQFRGPHVLRSWLRDSSEGQAIIADLTPNLDELLWTTEHGRQLQQQVIERHKESIPHCVVELWPDGYVRVYAPDVRVRIVTRSLAGNQREEEAETERCRARMPLFFQEIYDEKVARASFVSLFPLSDLWSTAQVERLVERMLDAHETFASMK